MSEVTERLKALIYGLEFSRGTHIDWAEWFEENPNDERMASLGDAEFHRKCEAEYNERISAVGIAINEIEKVRDAITMYLDWFDHPEHIMPEEEMLNLLRAAVKPSGSDRDTDSAE